MSHAGAQTHNDRPVAARRGGGRPTREEAARRDERLLEVATNLFMARGFDGTTIDAVSDIAGISKPTVYARYGDKRALFAAVLRDRIQAWLARISAAAEARANANSPEDIETALHELSRHLLAQALLPECITLLRILAAQASHFPELAELAHEEGWQRAVRSVATLLTRFSAQNQIRVENPEVEADLLLDLLLGQPSRLALYGLAIDPRLQEQRRQAAVTLFLNGIRTRPSSLKNT